MSTTYAIDRFEVRRDTLVWAALLVNTQLLLVAAYYALSPNEPRNLMILLPVVWITVGILAVLRVDPPPAPQKRRTIAVAVATAYFGLLAYFGGLWGLPDPTLPVGADLGLATGPPGWTPRLAVNTPVVMIVIIPFKLIGYAALGYLVYVAILDAAGSAVSGVVGLLSCVSCTWPVIAAIVSSVVGSGTAAAEAAIGLSLPLSTVVFVVTVALLYWRPGWG